MISCECSEWGSTFEGRGYLLPSVFPWAKERKQKSFLEASLTPCIPLSGKEVVTWMKNLAAGVCIAQSCLFS